MGIGLEYVQDPATRRNFQHLDALLEVLQQIPFFTGSGSPNGTVTASPPAVYFNRSGGAGTTLYVKESGSNTNTGWIGK